MLARACRTAPADARLSGPAILLTEGTAPIRQIDSKAALSRKAKVSTNTGIQAGMSLM